LQGINYWTQSLNNLLNARSNYAGVDIGTAENSAQGNLTADIANQQAALTQAGTLSGYEFLGNQGLNQYGLQAAGLNDQYNSSTFGTEGNIFGSELNYNSNLYNQFGIGAAGKGY
jgi:hypothetical protein